MLQLDWKSRWKLIQNAQNLLNITFWWKNWPALGPSISGTKCDRDNPTFFCRKSELIGVCRKIGTQSDWKSQKWGSSPWNFSTMFKYGSTHSGVQHHPRCEKLEPPMVQHSRQAVKQNHSMDAWILTRNNQSLVYYHQITMFTWISKWSQKCQVHSQKITM